jgi:dynein heavy chain 1
LFLTCEITPKLPVNLLRAGRIFTFEPPPGVQANLLRTFSAIPPARMMKPPNERARLYFILAWFHAIVQERLRYVPLGWSKSYEFNESDLRVACDMLDTWIDTVSMGRTNLPPKKVPWQAIQTLMAQVIYGGKIDNEYDQRLLVSFIGRLFVEHSFDGDYHLIKNADIELKMPEGIRRDQFLAWVEALSSRQTPSWLGLPNNADTLLLTQRGQRATVMLLRLQDIEEEEEDVGEEEVKQSDWMRSLGSSVAAWMKLLPSSLPSLKRSAENIKDPMYRFIEREAKMASSILRNVRLDLAELQAICGGTKKQTNHHRVIGMELMRGVIPRTWIHYKIPSTLTVATWLADFGQRLKQLEDVIQSVGRHGALSLRSHTYWLGGLFNPEAFITATRQCVAQANSWSLEDLELDIFVTDAHDDAPPSMDDFSFGLKGLKMHGAISKSNELHISEMMTSDLSLVRLRWINRKNKMAASKEGKRIMLPVYLNTERTVTVFTAEFTMASGQDEKAFIEKGVALIANA